MKFKFEKDELIMFPETEMDIFNIGRMFNNLLTGSVDFGVQQERKIVSYRAPTNVIVERLAKIAP
jgi:hypothetical protein